MTHRHETHVVSTTGTDNKPIGEALTANAFSYKIIGLSKAESVTVNLYCSNQGSSTAGLTYVVDYSIGKFYNESTSKLEDEWTSAVSSTTSAANNTYSENALFTTYPQAVKLRIGVKSTVADTPAKYRLRVTTVGST